MVTLAGYQIWQGVIQKSIPQGVIVIQNNTICPSALTAAGGNDNPDFALSESFAVGLDLGFARAAKEAETAALDPVALDQHRRELVDWAKGALAASSAELQSEAALATTGIAVLEADAQGELDLRFERAAPLVRSRAWALAS